MYAVFTVFFLSAGIDGAVWAARLSELEPTLSSFVPAEVYAQMYHPTVAATVVFSTLFRVSLHSGADNGSAGHGSLNLFNPLTHRPSLS